MPQTFDSDMPGDPMPYHVEALVGRQIKSVECPKHSRAKHRNKLVITLDNGKTLIVSGQGLDTNAVTATIYPRGHRGAR